MDKGKQTFAMNALRRASYKWFGRYKALQAAKSGRNQYHCAKCANVFGKKDIQLDHVIPVVDPDKGWDGFDSFVDRLLVDTDGFQVLCKPCHKEKTLAENKIRVEPRRAKRKKKATSEVIEAAEIVIEEFKQTKKSRKK